MVYDQRPIPQVVDEPCSGRKSPVHEIRAPRCRPHQDPNQSRDDECGDGIHGHHLRRIRHCHRLRSEDRFLKIPSLDNVSAKILVAWVSEKCTYDFGEISLAGGARKTVGMFVPVPLMSATVTVNYLAPLGYVEVLTS